MSGEAHVLAHAILAKRRAKSFPTNDFTEFNTYRFLRVLNLVYIDNLGYQLIKLQSVKFHFLREAIFYLGHINNEYDPGKISNLLWVQKDSFVDSVHPIQSIPFYEESFRKVHILILIILDFITPFIGT